VNQEDSKQNEVDGIKKGADSTGEVTHIYYLKERLVICNDEDKDCLGILVTLAARMIVGTL